MPSCCLAKIGAIHTDSKVISLACFYFQPNFLILKKIKGDLRDHLAVCVSPLIYEAYEITLLSVCPPIIFSLSMRSVSYQREVG
jgi:hypothetical protein